MTRCFGVLQRVVCSTNSLLVAHRVLRHERCLNTVASSSVPGEPGWKPPAIDWTARCDVLVRARTGSGKTSAYIIPAVESCLDHIEELAKHVASDASSKKDHLPGCSKLMYEHGFVRSLVLAPTRESAVQIASDAQKLTMHWEGFEVQLLAGGADKARQKKDWMESPRNLVVATPGRLRDLLTNEPGFRSGFKGCPMLILDEADTLLSMGFRDDIDAIVSFLPRSPLRQTILFSATTPRAVRQLASWILSPDHTFVHAIRPESGSAQDQLDEHLVRTELPVACGNDHSIYNHVEQYQTLCPTASDQLPTLLKLLVHDQLTHGSRSKAIVFCPTTQMVELFARSLRLSVEKALPDSNTEIMKMHWQMKQSERTRVRLLFREAGKTLNSRPALLVTSDISAGATDYPGLTRTIQVGVPSKESMHIYRIRRIARGARPFVSGKGIENNRPTVRADLLLLPWEAGYMNWQLTSLPIRPLPIHVLDAQLASLSPQLPVPRFDVLQSALVEIQRSTNPADVRSTAASLLGYYLPLTPPLRLRPHDVLSGVSSWASECFHVSIPGITRFPKKFTEAYEQSVQLGKTKGLFVDGLKLAGPSLLGKAKSRNRSVWEGADKQARKPRRWY